ncbi:hypothetical protein J132_11360 [Termitomyces sp. J132]|nr:hypothetical protein J132_11360 [Termitomyces sp. J132]
MMEDENKRSRKIVGWGIVGFTQGKEVFACREDLGLREVFTRMVQCRIGHMFIGEYYTHFVPTESAGCPCGEPYQTREHVIKECDLYRPYREVLWEINRDLDLEKLLGTIKGIAAWEYF